jgi:hypothetical protein
MARIAFYTFGVLYESRGHPQVQPFWDMAPAVFEAAAQAPGFIARSTASASWGAKVSPRFYDRAKHPQAPLDNPNVAAPMTLSLWTDLEAVAAFAYQAIHLEALRQRKAWFRTPAWPTYVAWWVTDDETPTWAEAVQRLEYLHDHGPTPYAFNFTQPFDSEGHARELQRA